MLTVFGLGATILFSLWTLYLVFKRRYPGRITFFKELSIGLYDTIAKDLPELDLLYKKNPVAENHVLLKGAFLNTGSIDITSSIVEIPITIKLPNEYKWLAAKIVSGSDNIQAKVEFNEQSLIIKSGLFRSKEYIRFQALAQVPLKDDNSGEISHIAIGERLEEALQFDHRIASTRKIDKQDIESRSRIAKLLTWRLTFLGIAAISLIALAVTYYIGVRSGEFVYSFIPEKGKILQVKIQPLADGSIKVKGIDRKYSEILQPEEFFSKCKGKPSIVKKKVARSIIVCLIIGYIGLPLSLSFIYHLIYRRNKKLRKVLALEP